MQGVKRTTSNNSDHIAKKMNLSNVYSPPTAERESDLVWANQHKEVDTRGFTIFNIMYNNNPANIIK